MPVAIAGACLAFCSGSGTDRRCDRATARPTSCSRSRTSPECAAVFQLADRDGAGVVAGGFGFSRLRRDRIAQALMAFAVARDRRVSRLRRVRSLVVPAVPAAGAGGLRDLRGGRAVGVDRTMAVSAVARRCCLRSFRRDRARHRGWRDRSTRSSSPINCAASSGRRLHQRDVPPAAVIVSGEQSGSMRYYTDRPILRWERPRRKRWPRPSRRSNNRGGPSTSCSTHGRTDRSARSFAALPVGALDWPPVLDAGTSHRTRLWKLGDRERFLRGENLTTIRLP